jgi:Flp pilus assembly protein TadG
MIWAAIILLLLILLVGLGLDSAKGFLTAHQLQNAADAAALAGARVVKIDPNEARMIAIAVAQENFADGNGVQLKDNPDNLPDGDIVVGRYDRDAGKFTPTLFGANALKVVARRTETSPGGPVPINFGPVVGVDTVNVERYAIAMTSGGTGAGLICLRPDETGLIVNGTVTLRVIDVNDDDIDEGAIQVNSEADDATRLIGTPELLADALNIWGDLSYTGGIDPAEFPFPIDTSAPPIPDPLCPDPEGGQCVPPPSWDPVSDLREPNMVAVTEGAHVFSPGYYPEGFRITGGDVTFAPGIYVLDGNSKGLTSGLVVSGNTNLCAKGVMFFITGDGVLDLGGTGNLRITPPEFDNVDFCDPSFTSPPLDYDSYEGISIFQDRDNFNDARIVGTSMMDLDGTLYFPKNHLDLTGTGDGFGNQLITWSLEVSGTGDILINYDGRNKSPGMKSYIVE